MKPLPKTLHLMKLKPRALTHRGVPRIYGIFPDPTSGSRVRYPCHVNSAVQNTRWQHSAESTCPRPMPDIQEPMGMTSIKLAVRGRSLTMWLEILLAHAASTVTYLDWTLPLSVFGAAAIGCHGWYQDHQRRQNALNFLNPMKVDVIAMPACVDLLRSMPRLMIRRIGAQLGQGMSGTVSRATLKDGAQVAVKTARRDCFLGLGRAEYEVAKDGLHASSLANEHLCQFLGSSWSFGNAYTVWQLLPATSRASHDLFLEHYHFQSAGFLHDSLRFLAKVVLYLNDKSFPLFHCHTSDVYIVPDWLACYH